MFENRVIIILSSETGVSKVLPQDLTNSCFPSRRDRQATLISVECRREISIQLSTRKTAPWRMKPLRIGASLQGDCFNPCSHIGDTRGQSRTGREPVVSIHAPAWGATASTGKCWFYYFFGVISANPNYLLLSAFLKFYYFHNYLK